MSISDLGTVIIFIFFVTLPIFLVCWSLDSVVYPEKRIGRSLKKGEERIYVREYCEYYRYSHFTDVVYSFEELKKNWIVRHAIFSASFAKYGIGRIGKIEFFFREEFGLDKYLLIAKIYDRHDDISVFVKVAYIDQIPDGLKDFYQEHK